MKRLLLAIALLLVCVPAHAQRAGPCDVRGCTMSGPLSAASGQNFSFLMGGNNTTWSIGGGTGSGIGTPLTLTAKSAVGGVHQSTLAFQGTTTSDFFTAPSANTQTISGANTPVSVGNWGGGWAGSSTSSNNLLAQFQFGSASDALALPSGGFNVVFAQDQLAAGWDGSRTGVFGRIFTSGDTTLTNTGAQIIGLSGASYLQNNAGGVSTGYGTSSFGAGTSMGLSTVGALKCPNVSTQCATWARNVVGGELDFDAEANTNASGVVGVQVVGQAAHAVKGVNYNYGYSLSEQTGASAGLDQAVVVGRYDSQWPLDASTGYLFQVQSGVNHSTKPSAGAAGFDLNQFAASGASGAIGSGFYWRSPGVRLNDTELVAGYLSIGANASGAVLDTTYSKMATAAGSITVAAGGSNYTTGDVACDTNGDCVRVNATGGAVTSVAAVISYGLKTSPPADPVSFTAMTRNGSSFGSGLTLNLGSWTAKHQLLLGSTSTDVLLIGGSVAQNATAGFAHPFPLISTGAPNGTPSVTANPGCGINANASPAVLNCYIGGAWQHVTFTAGAG